MRALPRHVWGPTVPGTNTVTLPGRTFTVEVDRRTCATCGTTETAFSGCGLEHGSGSDACWAAVAHVLCVRCGHEPYEGCGDWCDRLARTEAASDLCCDGQCLYPGDPAPTGTEGLEQTEQRAAEAAGVTVEALYRTHRAEPCPCDDAACSGWRVVAR